MTFVGAGDRQHKRFIQRHVDRKDLPIERLERIAQIGGVLAVA
jgi:hypothetical protein